MVNELLIKPDQYAVTKDYFDANIPRLREETDRDFDLFKAFLWTNLTPNKFINVIINTPEKIQAYLDTRKKPDELKAYADNLGIHAYRNIVKKNNWVERRSEYRYKIAQQVQEDIAFKFLNDSLENFALAQEASKQGLVLMNELLSLGLVDPQNFNGKRFSELASGMKIVFEEGRLYAGSPTENINVKTTKSIESDETKAQLDTLLEKIDDLQDAKDDIIEAEVVKKK